MQIESVPVLSILHSHWEAGGASGLSQMDFDGSSKNMVAISLKINNYSLYNSCLRTQVTILSTKYTY